MKSQRTYLITLWNDTDTYDYEFTLNLIINTWEKHAYIIHDMDAGVKTHTHICIYTEKTTLNKIQELIPMVPKEHIEIFDTLNNCLLYLVHAKNKEKYQYPLYLVNGSLKSKLLNIIDTEREFTDMQLILTYINQYNITSVKELLPFIYDNCKWSSFRRNFSIINQVLTENRINGKM